MAEIKLSQNDGGASKPYAGAVGSVAYPNCQQDKKLSSMIKYFLLPHPSATYYSTFGEVNTQSFI